jgi:predicted Zn finger-like uncharacterized protein
MNCQCPGCKKSFPVDPNKVPPDGVFARCSNCDEVFFVQVPEDGPKTIPLATDVAQPAIEEPALEVEAEEADDLPKEAWEPQGDVEVVTEEVGEVAGGEDMAEALTVEEEPAQDPTERAGKAEPEADEEPQFGRRDPAEKAQRLARVLVSDIILYNPDRHDQALEAGEVKEEFEDEIQKSWAEYVEQVGDEVANGTPYFTEALNEILAKGQDIF